MNSISEGSTPIGVAKPCCRVAGSSSTYGGSPFGTLATHPVGANVVSVNDDEAERKQRRLSGNMCNFLSPGCHTPRSTNTNDRSHAVVSSASALSNSQLTEHYANCIKLSSQNKISSKNAFGLHLIDHMLKVLRQRGDISNFQVASSTLDASTKIYAGRVDSIYNDTFKVLGGLGREHRDNKEDQEADKDGEVGEVVKKRARRGMKASTTVVIEECPSVLDITNFETEFRVDPLFQKTSAAFDEGGVSGLLLNNIDVRDDGCGLQLDGSQKLVLSDHPSEAGIMLHIDKGLFDLEALQTRQICPTFANFKFNTSTSDEEAGCSLISQGGSDGVRMTEGGGGGEGEGANFTMLDAPSTSSEYIDGHDDNEGCRDMSFVEGGGTSQLLQGETSFQATRSDNQVAQVVTALAGAGSEVSAGSLNPGLSGLCLTDFIEPSDYSYFTPAVIASWAGPQHWKFRPRNMVAKMADEKQDRKRKRVAPYKVDFTKAPTKSQLGSSKVSTCLSEAVRNKIDSSHTTLPQHTHNNADMLSCLFCKPNWKVKRRKRLSGVVDEILEGDWYNYGNNNDQLNFCPLVDDANSDTAMDESVPVFCDSQEMFLNETVCQQGELAGENLISKPHEVGKVKINYATNAKKIDVTKLKAKMWEVISQPQQEEDGDEGNSNSQMAAPSDEGESGHGIEFSFLYSKLPSLLSTGSAKNMTVPVCFVCLLYLANEKELKLSSRINLSDFTILT